jgi:hypothetical protein
VVFIRGRAGIGADTKVLIPLQDQRQRATWLEKGEHKVNWLSRTKAAKSVGDGVLSTIICTLPKRK